MRTSVAWFSGKAQLCWRAKPARSLMVLVPQGCNESVAARLISKWTEDNVRPPVAYANHKPLVIRVSSDTFANSDQFVRRVVFNFTKKAGTQKDCIQIEIEEDGYPSDILRDGIESMLAAGVYPVMVVERFHAFANLPDGGMSSVLATMRELENNGELTTVTLTPVSYEEMRRTMEKGRPFLNSVYGDNHDQAIMDPISREEFVAEAGRRGISEHKANSLFARGGGPDVVFETLLDLANVGIEELERTCALRAGAGIDSFISRSFGGNSLGSGDLLSQLALGRLRSTDEAALAGTPLFNFIGRRIKGGAIRCVSRILSLRILHGSEGRYKLYGDCYDAYLARDFVKAGALAEMLPSETGRLFVFKEFVRLQTAILPQVGRGLLGFDWNRANSSGRLLLSDKSGIVRPYAKWISEIVQWSELVKASGTASGRIQLDQLTRRAADIDIRKCLIFMIKAYFEQVNELDVPALRVAHLINIPEAILQSLASAHCGIDFISAPEVYPNAQYAEYFDGSNEFVLPSPGSKLALTSLLVIVPAVIASRLGLGISPLGNPSGIRELQKRFVDRVRNPASHTIAEFKEGDAEILATLCASWIQAWADLDGYSDPGTFPGTVGAPTVHGVGAILFGTEE